MQVLARLAAALTAAFWPVLSLAQRENADPVWDRSGYKWVWVVSALVVVLALFRLLTGHDRPTARRAP